MWCFVSESIFGYKDLEVQLYYTAGRLETYLSMKYLRKVDSKKFDGAMVSQLSLNGYCPVQSIHTVFSFSLMM